MRRDVLIKQAILVLFTDILIGPPDQSGKRDAIELHRTSEIFKMGSVIVVGSLELDEFEARSS